MGALEFICLTGSQEGTVFRPEGVPLTIGRAASCAVRLSDALVAVADVHAEVVRAGPGFLVRAVGDAVVLVNGLPVREGLIMSRDLIQLGREGPRLVFKRTGTERRETRSMSTLLHDSVLSARADGRTTRVSMALGVGKEFVREAVLHGTRTVRTVVVILAISLVAGGALLVAHLVRSSANTAELQDTIAGLGDQVQKRIDEVDAILRDIEVKERDLEQSGKSLHERIEAARLDMEKTTSRIGTLEQRGVAMRRLVREGQKAVALIHGTLAWQDAKTLLPVRHRLLFPGGPSTFNDDGSLVMTLDGDGPEITQTYFGTAFLVAEDGLMITNRHVADPWYGSESSEQLLAKGFKPIRKRLDVWFPGELKARKAERLAASTRVDVALVRVDPDGLKVGPLPLAPEGTLVEAGIETVLIGYPAGIAGLVVKLTTKARDELLEGMNDPDYELLIRRLAARDAVRPTITSGLLGDALPEKLIYETATTSGGSGGPLCDAEGRVIGVNYAIFEAFRGQNFGVPLPFVHEILKTYRAGSK